MRLDTILDYTYDVNYSVQKGECLKLDMNKSLSYCMEYEDHIGASNTIPFEMESVDIDGEGRIYHTSTSGFKYDCYLKDHLGSTRMVVNDEDVVTEAFAYQPYGTIISLEDIAATPQTPTRQQFTGKEFDQEGSVEGVSDGIAAFYFGARFYDPEIGTWFSCDAAGQFYNPYGYASNPIIYVDPDGNWFWIDDAIAAGLGFVAGYVGNGLSTGDWGGRAFAMGGVGAVAGLGALYTGGASSGGLATGGVVGGAIAGGGGYSVGAAFGDYSWNAGDFGKAVGFGAISGAAGGMVGGAVGNGIYGAMAGGFTSGAVGTALNGGDFSDIMLGGLGCAAFASASYTAGWALTNFTPVGNAINDYYEGKLSSSDVDARYVGKQSADWLVSESNKIYQSEINVRGNSTELGMGSRKGSTITGKPAVRYKFYSSGEKGHVRIEGAKWTYRLHNHPGGSAPSFGDYMTARTNWNNGIYSQYGLYSDGRFYGYQSTPGNYIYWSY